MAEEALSTPQPSEDGKPDDDEDAEAVGFVPQEILDKLPPQERRTLVRSVTAIMSGMMPNPLYAKMTQAHIDKIIDYTEEDNRRDAQQATEVRSHEFRLFLAAVVSVLILTGFLVLAQQINVLYSLMLALLGIAGRYGLANRHRS